MAQIKKLWPHEKSIESFRLCFLIMMQPLYLLSSDTYNILDQDRLPNERELEVEDQGLDDKEKL